MNQEYADLNVVILPDKSVRDLVIGWSKQIGEHFDTRFVLDGISYNPHISIYQTRYPKKNLDRVDDVLGQMAESTSGFLIKLDKLTTFLEFIFFDCVIDKNIMDFHYKTLSLLNPLREGMIPSDHQKMLHDDRVPEERKKSIIDYGYPLAQGAFSPHITISRLKTDQFVKDALKTISFQGAEFIAESIALAYTDHDGTCKNIFKTFELK